ncbi:UNVERIFIED_CONTAM: hypothetical protein PYX00_008452 [Menopon gallinae]|uniref:Uncharacterized protein n=1 Tax=Menopon gallinae TaxID=328185 RepID=A0AAW2HPG7_9NEOP
MFGKREEKQARNSGKTMDKEIKSNKIAKVFGDTKREREFNIIKRRNGGLTNQNVETSHLPVPDRKQHELVGEKPPVSRGRTSFVGNRIGLKVKSKDNIGSGVRKSPFKVTDCPLPDKDFPIEENKPGETRSTELVDVPSPALTFSYSEKTNTIKDENGSGLLYQKGGFNRDSCRTVVLIDGPHRVLEEDVYKVQNSKENAPITKTSDIYKVPPEYILRDCQKMRHSLPCGYSNNHFQKPLTCMKCYQLELEERLMLEEKKMYCGEPHGHRCTHDDASYDRLHCCNVFGIRQCCQPYSRTPRHQIDDLCFCPLVRSHSDEKTIAICKETSNDYMAERDEVGHVPPFSKSDNACGRSKLKNKYHEYQTTYTVRPISVIPTGGKSSPVTNQNWQSAQAIAYELRPKSAVVIPEEGLSRGRKYMCCQHREHCPKNMSYDRMTIPSEIEDCAEAYETDLSKENSQKSVKKKKIMKICNCPHLHMEENTIKKFCIQQCVNKNQTDLKPGEERRKYLDKQTDVDLREEAEDKVVVEKKEIKISVDAQKRFLTKSTSALLMNNKEERRKGESLKSRLRLPQARKHSIGTETKGADSPEQTLGNPANENATKETEPMGNSDCQKRSTNFIPLQPDRNLTDITEMSNMQEGSVQPKGLINSENPDGKESGSEGLMTSSEKDESRNKCVSLLKLYEDLIEFQRMVDSGSSGNGEDDRRRKKLRYQLAHHLQELLKISDDGFHVN